MRKILIVLMLGLLAVSLYRCNKSLPEPTKVGAVSPSQAHDSDPRPAGDHERGSAERVAESPPRLPGQAETPRVVLDRGPRKEGEHPDRYEDRVWFTERFDAFVRESGVTDAQVQELLLALYDYTTQRRYAMDILRDDVRKGGTVNEDYVMSLFADGNHQFNIALQRILNVSQRLLYMEHCISCARSISYYTHYEPILQLSAVGR